jgi:hypothetical protein
MFFFRRRKLNYVHLQAYICASYYITIVSHVTLRNTRARNQELNKVLIKHAQACGSPQRKRRRCVGAAHFFQTVVLQVASTCATRHDISRVTLIVGSICLWSPTRNDYLAGRSSRLRLTSSAPVHYTWRQPSTPTPRNKHLQKLLKYNLSTIFASSMGI